MELVAVNYIDLTEVGYVLSRTLIAPNQTSLQISHTGLETGVTALDLGLLNQRSLAYSTAKNIDAINNRLILSNLTTGDSIDFGPWTETWTHALAKVSITSVGDPYGGNFSVNEYQLPLNVYSKMAFMANEVYRFSAKFKLKDGSITNNFWIDDIAITTFADNKAVDGTDITLPSRRTAGLNDYNLSNSTTTTYVYTINFTFNVDDLVGGVPVRNLVDEIIIEQVEMVEQFKEILATGALILGVSSDQVNVEGRMSNTSKISYSDIPPVGNLKIGEYFFVTGEDNGAFPTYDPGPSFGNSTHAVAWRSYVAFYAPDLIYGLTSITPELTQDKIINFGNPFRPYANASALGGTTFASSYAGYTGQTATVTPQIASVSQYQYLGAGQDATIDGRVYSKGLGGTDGLSAFFEWINRGSPVIHLDADLLNISVTYTDMGMYYGQYYRKRTYTPTNPDISKFGDRNLSKYISTQAIIKITSSTSSSVTKQVFGDVFTQKNYLKNRFANFYVGGTMNPDELGWDGGISFYSQNRVNAQMTNKHVAGTGWEFPNSTFGEWMQRGPATADTLPPYNHGYDSRNSINADVAFDENSLSQTDLPTRIIWSQLKPQDSLTDNYRNFLALDFKDLEPTLGEIVHHANANGELVTWQLRAFMRQYFNARGQLETSSSLNVIIGDGAVMERNGQTLSVIGSKHKWSIIKGKSDKGNDVFYWINTELDKAIRFGYDGTISLADIRGMRSWFANNLTWVDEKDTPADGQGIHGTFDDRFSEVIWTVRGKRTEPTYASGITYSQGQIVSFGPEIFSTFEQTGEIYVSLQNSNTGNTPPNFGSTSLFWQLIPHTGSVVINGTTYNASDYYNEYTLVFNEIANRFQSFFTFKPKIYLHWKDGYFSPRPISDSGNVYVHDLSSRFLSWYEQFGSVQEENGFIEPAINKSEEITKWWTAVDVDCEKTPYRFDFKTKNHVSFLTTGEFEDREDGSYSPIKCDSTATPLVNDNETTLLFGRWLKAKMFFEVGVYQKLTSLIVKFRASSRLFNK